MMAEEAKQLSSRAQELLVGTEVTADLLPYVGYNSGGETIHDAAARL